ncbi:unnamed protein product [Dovyalis caffra]|uniref:F-box domain-containing protein n=1 Tax=Dovyalis caffra TaxID=77055 RepID=A0AAV1S2U5_9ROSI|nr:unnamed protein product [Dovyalis caffra]
MNSPKQQNSSSVQAVIGNDDLLTEILFRLPARSVLKFKFVSMRWLSIISGSSFAIRHTHFNPHTISSLIFKVSYYLKRPPSFRYVSLDGKSLVNNSSDFLNFDPNNAGRSYVYNSCNGLLLCSKRRGYSFERSILTDYIFNPSTRQFAILPPRPGQGNHFNRIQLAFDPSKSPSYQVVCTHFFNSVIKIYVYSSDTKDWRLSANEENFDSLSVNFDKGVFWNRAIHWMSLMGNGFSFFLDKESFQTIPRPPLPENWHDQNFGYFGESGGNLHFIGLVAANQTNPDDFTSLDMSSDQSIVVYALEKGCSEWFVKYCLQMNAIVLAYPKKYCLQTNAIAMAHPGVIEYLTFSPFSEIVLSFIEGNSEAGPLLVMRIPGDILSYSFKGKTFKKILSLPPFDHASYCAFKHGETLSWSFVERDNETGPLLVMNIPDSPKQKKSSSVDAVIDNDDLLTGILVRLPAKSVLKFKLVCKKWLYIISHPSFAIHHTYLNPHTISALILKLSFLFNKPSSYQYVSLDGKSLVTVPSDFLRFDHKNPGSTFVSQSCNGLLLCSRRRWYSGERTESTDHYVFNPTTRQFAILPPPAGQGIHFNWIQLAFDPSKSPRYQVVCTHFLNSVLKIQVYSSETKDWKLCVNQENFDSLCVNFANCVVWNGALHWISPMGNGFSFLLDKECLQKIPRPPLPENWQVHNFRYFGESGGHLHFIGFQASNINPDDLSMGIISPYMSTDQSPDQSIVVYAMEGGCSKWFIKYSLHINAITMACPGMIEDPPVLPFSAKVSVKVLSFIDESDEKGPLMVLNIPGGIISYSFKDKTFNNIWSFAPFKHAICDAFNYTETLSWI